MGSFKIIGFIWKSDPFLPPAPTEISLKIYKQIQSDQKCHAEIWTRIAGHEVQSAANHYTMRPHVALDFNPMLPIKNGTNEKKLSNIWLGQAAIEK